MNIQHLQRRVVSPNHLLTTLTDCITKRILGDEGRGGGEGEGDQNMFVSGSYMYTTFDQGILVDEGESGWGAEPTIYRSIYTHVCECF